MFTLHADSSQDSQDASVVKEGNLQSFMQDVIATSDKKPVVVHFWAPGSTPCAQLKQILEKHVREQKGKIHLVNINIDSNPQLAHNLQVQSAPTVYAFFKRQPVDALAGAISQAQVQQLLQQLKELCQNTADLIEEAFTLLSTDKVMEAQAIFLNVLQEDSRHAKALIGLSRCYIKTGQIEAARGIFDGLPDNLSGNDESEKKALATALKLASQAPGVDLNTLQKQSSLEPCNLQLLYDLSIAQFQSHQAQEAVDTLLTIIKRERNWQEGKAKTQLLDFFESLGFQNPVSIAGRKALAQILFA